MPVINQFKGEYRFLSNFYLSEMLINGKLWATVEHAFQAAKTEHLAEQQRIRAEPDAWRAKRRGGVVRLRPGWDRMKYGVMLEIVREKFKQNLDLRKKLLATGDAILVEGNYWHDNIWGICWCGCSRGKNVGTNWLGLILMQVRLELR